MKKPKPEVIKFNYTLTVDVESQHQVYCVVASSLRQALYFVSQEMEYDGKHGIVPSFEALENSRPANSLDDCLAGYKFNEIIYEEKETT